MFTTAGRRSLRSRSSCSHTGEDAVLRLKAAPNEVQSMAGVSMGPSSEVVAAMTSSGSCRA
jgi:hypothetical protein